MVADEKVQAADRPDAVRVRAVAAPNPQQRSFWIGLACAAALHAALIIGITRSLPRQMGEASGRPDGISVVLVDAADLESKNTFPEAGGPAGSVAPAPPAPPAAKEAAHLLEKQKQKPAPRPSDKEAPESAAPPDEAAKQGKVAKQRKQEAPTWPIDTQALESVLAPDQAAKQSEAGAASKQAAKPPPLQPPAPQPSPPLQLSLPDGPIVPGGRSASFARPAGITRSGENDEFGRGVIRALRKTMPAPGPLPGRVTVRFFLSDNGNLVEVRLVRSAGNPSLDQSVVFAVKQASFPIPPVASTLIDRTFLVTYIYE